MFSVADGCDRISVEAYRQRAVTSGPLWLLSLMLVTALIRSSSSPACFLHSRIVEWRWAGKREGILEVGWNVLVTASSSWYYAVWAPGWLMASIIPA